MSQLYYFKENIYFYCKWNIATKMWSLVINSIEITLKGNLVEVTEIEWFQFFFIAKHAWTRQRIEIHSSGYKMHYFRGRNNEVKLQDRAGGGKLLLRYEN